MALALALALVALAALVFWWGQRPQDAAGRAHEPSPAGVEDGLAAAAPVRSPDPGPVPSTPAQLRLPPARMAPSGGEGMGALEGLVVSARTGLGLGGAEVTLSSPSGGAQSTRTAADGRFEFHPPQAGTYQVAAARAPGHLPFGPEWGRSPLVVTAAPGHRVNGLVIALHPAPELEGKVLTADGVPAGDAAIRLLFERTGESALFPLQERFTTDAAGAFRFSAAEGTTVEARHPTEGAARRELSLGDLDAGRVELRLSRPAVRAHPPKSVQGRVLLPDGTGASGAVVQVRSADRSYPEVHGDPAGYGAITDPTGYFEVVDVPAGTYDVTAMLLGFAPARRSELPVPCAPLSLQLEEGASLVGEVRASDGSALHAFAVDLRWRKGPLVQLDYAQGTFVDPEGRYRMEGLRPGGYLARVFATGYLPSEREVNLSEGVREVRADFQLRRGGRIKGRVVSGEPGAPLPRARVRIEGLIAPGAAARDREATTDASGSFELLAVPEGGASLLVEAQGHISRLVSSVLPGPVEIRLTPLTEDAGEANVELVGIGAALKARDDGLVVGQVFPGGGAAQGGIVPGDEIVTVDGTRVTELGFQGSVDRIRGEAGSKVVLGIRRQGALPEVAVEVVRRKVAG